MVVRLGKHDGFRTINIVRRPEAVAELEALGADVVLSTSDGPIEDRVRAAVGEAGVRHALDPVGGATGGALVRCLAPGGRMLAYGSLSEEPLPIRSRTLITGGLAVEGFWLGHFMRSRTIPENLLLFRAIGRLIRSGVLATEPGPTYPLASIREAVTRCEGAARAGKVLLTIG
jgi:NADPH:quinone reductase-like Zn-dependent oxidoreductase